MDFLDGLERLHSDSDPGAERESLLRLLAPQSVQIFAKDRHRHVDEVRLLRTLKIEL